MEATLSQPGRPARRPVVPNAVLGTLLFIVAEAMFFAGMLSAYTISRANQLPGMWPPPNQPVLPVHQAAINTGVLLLSAVVLAVAFWRWRRSPAAARVPLALGWGLGVAFFALQAREWASLLSQGLTVNSSALGQFFYLLVGSHLLHVVAALGVMGWALMQLFRGRLTSGLFFGVQTFWYFVVVVWPVIFARLYF